MNKSKIEYILIYLFKSQKIFQEEFKFQEKQQPTKFYPKTFLKVYKNVHASETQ